MIIEVKGEGGKAKTYHIKFQNRTKDLASKSENLEMSGTGFGSHSDCSAYNLSTNINNDMNNENMRNFLERFSQFNPEAQPPLMFETKNLDSETRGL